MILRITVALDAGLDIENAHESKPLQTCHSPTLHLSHHNCGPSLEYCITDRTVFTGKSDRMMEGVRM